MCVCVCVGVCYICHFTYLIALRILVTCEVLRLSVLRIRAVNFRFFIILLCPRGPEQTVDPGRANWFQDRSKVMDRKWTEMHRVPNLAVTAKQRKFRVGQLVLDVLRQRLLSVRMLGHAGWRRRLWGCLMALRCLRFRCLKSHSLQKTFTLNCLIHSSHTLHMAAQCSEHSNKFGPATCSSAKAQWHSDKEKASESWIDKVKICKNYVHGY